VDDRCGAAIIAPPTAGTREMLMVLARRIGAALRDDNIRRRDQGGDLARFRKKLCYLPGDVLADALSTPGARRTLASEEACFVQDLNDAWGSGATSAAALAPDALLDLLDERLAQARPTFVTAAPDRLPGDVARGLRERLRILERE
jgi:hypothetical protein